MNLDCFNDPEGPELSTSTSRPQGSHPGRHSLPPANSLGLQHVMPSDSYSLSALHYYYPAPHHPPNYTHILSSSQEFQPQFPLPSASQSHIPSLRRTPSVPVNDNLRIAHAPTHSFPDQRNNLNSCNSQRMHAPSPIVILDPQPLPQAPYIAPSPIHIQPLPTSNTHSPVHIPNNPTHSP